MPSRNRTPVPDLAVDQFRGARVRGALLEVAGALATRPHPRHQWDDLARADAELRLSWVDRDVEMCQQALISAVQEGPAVLAETTRRIERYFVEKLAAALHGFEVGQKADLAATILRLTRETTEIIVAGAECAHSGSESTLERLRDEALEVQPVLEEVIELTTLSLADRGRA